MIFVLEGYFLLSYYAIAIERYVIYFEIKIVANIFVDKTMLRKNTFNNSMSIK